MLGQAVDAADDGAYVFDEDDEEVQWPTKFPNA